MDSNASKADPQQAGPTFCLLQTTEVASEVTGGGDLLQHFDLRTHYDALQRQPPPDFIAQSNYLTKPVGDVALRRGQGMQLSELLDPNWPTPPDASIALFELDALRGAFTFRSEEAVELSQEELGAPTYVPPVVEAKRPKDERNGRKEDKKEKKNDKSKHRERDKSKDKEGGSHKKDKKKKRKHGEREEDDRHKSKKSKHSEADP